MNRTIQSRGLLLGYSGTRTEIIITTREYGTRVRLLRAIRGLGACWGAAILAVFIPVAHFVLVPGLIVAGVMVAVRRHRTVSAIAGAAGTCPDCGAAGPMDIDGRAGEHHTTCRACGRRLTITPAVS